jgi:GST-like protein
MTYVLHGARGSGSSIIEAACAEIGAEVELRDLDMRGGEQRGPDYAAKNPHRKVPTLEAGGEIITESVAILLTLDERHPRAGLLPPPGSRPRAQALRLLLFLATELYPIVEIIDFPERFSPRADGNDAMRDRAKEIWRQRWTVVEDQIAGSPYAVDSGFSAADLYIAALSRWDLEAAWRKEHLPKVEALAAAVRARPAVAAVWARHFGQGA